MNLYCVSFVFLEELLSCSAEAGSTAEDSSDDLHHWLLAVVLLTRSLHLSPALPPVRTTVWNQSLQRTLLCGCCLHEFRTNVFISFCPNNEEKLKFIDRYVVSTSIPRINTE